MNLVYDLGRITGHFFDEFILTHLSIDLLVLNEPVSPAQSSK